MEDLRRQIPLPPLHQIRSVDLFVVGVEFEVAGDDLDGGFWVVEGQNPWAEFAPDFLVLGEGQVFEGPVVDGSAF